jgi:ATP-dependent helicase/nuclease subunit A
MTGSAGNRKPISFGDVLILVRRRGKAFDAIIQALKHAGVPVAGADRLKLTEHIAVIDLMNLADALLLPRDDLALAVALKKPPVRPRRRRPFDSRTRAHRYVAQRAGRTRARKWQARRSARPAGTVRAAICAGNAVFILCLVARRRWRASAHSARLGLEANDAIDEFLELALSYEQKAPASLQGFMARLRAADTEVKRDMEIARDEVRVMTVHGAKGLEASVVFLIDTTTSPVDSHRVNLIRMPPQGNAAPGAPGIVLWAGKKDDDLAPVATARNTMKEDTEDEYRRLLYVAMTRAADRLIVGGVQPRKASSALSWYTLIEKGLDASGLQSDMIETPHGPVRRFSRSGDVEPPAPAFAEKHADAATDLPNWLKTSAPKDDPADVLLRPSDSRKAAPKIPLPSPTRPAQRASAPESAER